jgi:DNA-3-methyladenine glycosylase II
MLELKEATLYLGRQDAILAGLIRKHGPCTYKPRPSEDYYLELISSIIGQQLSVKAARTIERRFLELFGGKCPSPEQILEADAQTFRNAGLSRAKAEYVRDLARHVLEEKLLIDKLPELDNEEVIKELIAVKGIGEWTAHMFLIFALGRLNVLPVGDLGLRSGVKLNYGLEELPTPVEIRVIAEKNNWAPYESVATWYMWESLDNAPK